MAPLRRRRAENSQRIGLRGGWTGCTWRGDSRRRCSAPCWQTVYRQFAQRSRAWVWARLHRVVLGELGAREVTGDQKQVRVAEEPVGDHRDLGMVAVAVDDERRHGDLIKADGSVPAQMRGVLFADDAPLRVVLDHRLDQLSARGGDAEGRPDRQFQFGQPCGVPLATGCGVGRRFRVLWPRVASAA